MATWRPGDLATIIDIAVTGKLAELERKRYAKTDKPRKSLQQTEVAGEARSIPAAVRRAVRQRDGQRCAFVGAGGRQCTEQSWLEFDHVVAWARGGDHSVDNVRLDCRAHNLHRADIEYGKHVMARYGSSAREAGGASQARKTDACWCTHLQRHRQITIWTDSQRPTVPAHKTV